MRSRTKTLLMIVAGLAICVLVVGAGLAAWFFVSVFDSAPSDEATASRAFDEARQRLGDAGAIIDIQGESAIVTRRPPDTATPAALERVQILTWDPDEQRLARITVPWWLVRFRDSPIDVSAEIGSGVRTRRASISADDIARYGPALLIEHTQPDGSRVLVWTE